MRKLRRAVWVAGLWVCSVPVVWADTAYVSDVINLTIRAAPANDAEYLGQIRSGDAVEVLESLGPKSFTRIRDADGREGWVTSRFLTDTPAARDQLAAAQTRLQQTEQALKALQVDHDEALQRLDEAGSALEMADENARLKGVIAQMEDDQAHWQVEREAFRAKRRMMLTGALLVAGGVVLGLLLPALGRRRKRYGDL